MNKKIKIISTIALTGMMGLNVLGSSSYAVNVVANGKTQVFDASTIGGKKIVPVVLDGKTDTVTRTEIKSKYPEAKNFSGSNQDKVATGETFKIGEDTYTVMVYGDINKDGSVNSSDALLIERYRTKDATLKLEADQKLVADVASRDGAINSSDSLRIKEFAVNMKRTPVDSVPDADKKPEEPVTNYDFDMTVNEDNMVDGKYIINGTKKAILKVTPKIDVTEDIALSVKVLGEDGEEVQGLSIANITVKDDDKFVKSPEITIPDDVAGANSKLTIQLFKGTEKVGEVEVEMHVTAPEVVNVSTKRDGTKNAKISLEALTGSTVKEIKYKVVKSDETVSNKADLVKTLPATDNKISDEVIANDELVENQAYKVFYVVVDNYGNESIINNALIVKDSAVDSEVSVTNIVAPTLVDASHKAFTWEIVDKDNAVASLASGQSLQITLYKDNAPIKTYDNVSGLSKDVYSDMSEEGTYKIGIVIKGDTNGTIKDSKEVLSNEVKVSQLNPVSNIKFEINKDGAYVLSWENSNKEFDDYTVTLTKWDTTTEDYVAAGISATGISKENTTATIPATMTKDLLYKATITVNSDPNQFKVNDSEAVTSEAFFVISSASLTLNKVDETSVTYDLTPVVVSGSDAVATYKVTVYEAYNDSTLLNPDNYKEIGTRDVQVVEDEDGTKHIVIDGLTQGKKYAFKLIANIGDITGESIPVDDVTKGIETKKTTPAISGLTIDKTLTAPVAGKIKVNNDGTVFVGTQTITLSENYTDEFKAAISDVVSKLETGDIVTVTNDKVTLELDSETRYALELGDSVEGKVLEIVGNNYQKTISTSKELSKVLVNTGIFDITGAKTEEIILTPGADVIDTTVAGRDFTVAGFSPVTINEVKVNTEKEVTLNVKGKELTVKTTNATNNNNLTFVNEPNGRVDGDEAIISFVAEGLSSAYTGTIEIQSIGGEVTVKQNSVALENVDLTVTVKNGTVDMTDFNGETVKTTVKVEEGNTASTLTVTAKKESPIALAGVEIKDYTGTSVEDMNKVTGITGNVVTEANIAEVIEFINSFGLKDTGATLTVSADSAEVIINFSEESTGGEVKGLAE